MNKILMRLAPLVGREGGVSEGLASGGKKKKSRKMRKKDGPGPVMVSDTLCPAEDILGI